MKSTSVILEQAKNVKNVLCSLDTQTKNELLLRMADALIESSDEILKEISEQLHLSENTVIEYIETALTTKY